VFERFPRLTREQECDRILQVCRPGPGQPELVVDMLDVQFKLLHDRSQVILGICGVLVSTSVVLMTGKIVARSHLLHERVIGPLLVAASAAGIFAAAIVVGAVLRIRWMTELPGSDLRAWILTSLRYRDGKTLAYRTSIALLLVSMALFQIAAVLAWID
jgi:hypothetical protein